MLAADSFFSVLTCFGCTQKEWVEVNWEGEEMVTSKAMNTDVEVDTLRTNAMEDVVALCSAKTVETADKIYSERPEVAADAKLAESEASSYLCTFPFFFLIPIWVACIPQI
jgi:hypothetical protein